MSIGITVCLEFRKDKSDIQFTNIIRGGGDFFIPANRDFVEILKTASGQNDVRNFDLPADVSVEIFLSFYLEVIDDNAKYSRKNVGFDWCFESQAARWERERRSVRQFEVNGVKYIHNPSYFDPGTLSLAQIGLLGQERNIYIDVVPMEFILLIDFMKCIDARYYDGASRLVYWLD